MEMEQNPPRKKGLTIELGLALHFLVTVVAVVLAYAAMQAKIEASIVQGAKNEAELKVTREVMDAVRMDVKAQSVKLDILMQSYERDANKYIREPKDRQ
jgi:hypothetical protein